MSGYLIDTSVFIASEQNRSVGKAPPGHARISVATLTELVAGAERAAQGPQRGAREQTLAQARKFIPLAYDHFVAEGLGRLLAAARDAGRRADLMDAIIAATGAVHELVVWTQDADFELLAELEPKLQVARA